MSHFKKAYGITMAHEGGYVNDPDDPGGETYKGVARNANPNWPGWEIIDRYKNMHSLARTIAIYDNNIELQELVRKLYKQKYFDPYNGDTMPVELACEMFDTAVNMGVGTVVKFLQEALNLLNRNERLHSDIAVDGGFGPNTLKCMHHFLSVDKNGEIILVNMLNALQAEKYINIMRNNPSQEKYARGWFNRVRIVNK